MLFADPGLAVLTPATTCGVSDDDRMSFHPLYTRAAAAAQAKHQTGDYPLYDDNDDANRVPGGAPVFLQRNIRPVIEHNVQFFEQNGILPTTVNVKGHELSWSLNRNFKYNF